MNQIKDLIKSGKITFISSNINKRREVQSFSKDIKVAEGVDIQEVLGNIDEVIVHKSIAIGANSLIEDTILEINDIEVVDIKYKMNELSDGDKAKWITSFAYNNGEKIFVYRGEIEGVILKEGKGFGFGFDPYFIPKELIAPLDNDLNYDIEGLTLAELNTIDLKKHFNARRFAFSNFLKNNFISEIAIKDVPTWNGQYQN